MPPFIFPNVNMDQAQLQDEAVKGCIENNILEIAREIINRKFYEFKQNFSLKQVPNQSCCVK